MPWHHKFTRGVRHACQSWEEERQPHENGLETCLPTAKKKNGYPKESVSLGHVTTTYSFTCAEAEAKGAALFRSWTLSAARNPLLQLDVWVGSPWIKSRRPTIGPTAQVCTPRLLTLQLVRILEPHHHAPPARAWSGGFARQCNLQAAVLARVSMDASIILALPQAALTIKLAKIMSRSTRKSLHFRIFRVPKWPKCCRDFLREVSTGDPRVLAPPIWPWQEESWCELPATC